MEGAEANLRPLIREEIKSRELAHGRLPRRGHACWPRAGFHAARLLLFAIEGDCFAQKQPATGLPRNGMGW
jgi:hypothetical protein